LGSLAHRAAIARGDPGQDLRVASETVVPGCTAVTVIPCGPARAWVINTRSTGVRQPWAGFGAALGVLPADVVGGAGVLVTEAEVDAGSVTLGVADSGGRPAVAEG
jgi:hypothetical protein